MSIEGALLLRQPRRASRHPQSIATVLASCWIVLIVLSALCAGVLAPHGSNAQDVTASLQGPSLSHLLGTDSLGRDVLVRMLYGARPTLIAAAIVVIITLVLGCAAGLAGGYIGGRLDRAFSLVADVGQSVPFLLISLVVFAIFPNGLFAVMTVTAFFMCVGMYRVVRSSTLTIRNELYVTAARAAGLSHVAIIRRHLVPRLAALVRVQASMMAALGIVIEIGLGFLGLDVAPPTPSWGNILADSSQYLTTDLWLLLGPLTIVALTIVSFGILGEAVRSPHMRPHARRSRTVRSENGASSASAFGPTSLTTESTSAVSSPPSRPAGDALLQVRHLSVATTGSAPIPLVDDVSFDVRRGEVLGLVGETGAGKSVVARSLLQLPRNTRAVGSLRLDGVELSDAPESVLRSIRGKRIGYVGQDPMAALDPLFRIGDQLAEAIRSHRRMSRPAARAEAVRLLRAVRLPSPEILARKFPFEVSGGQAQRAAIALALAGDPDLLIADEPTTALDVTVQMEVLGLLKELQRSRGLTIILVTHDWGVVADMCDRVLTLYAGEVVEEGSVRDVFAGPRHPYTAALRHADPHLQVPGQRHRALPGRVPAPGERPTGCRFADRCSLAVEECRSTHPALVTVQDGTSGRASRCIRIDALMKESTNA